MSKSDSSENQYPNAVQPPNVDVQNSTNKVVFITFICFFVCLAFAQISDVLHNEHPAKLLPFSPSPFYVDLIPVPSNTFYLAAVHFYAINIFDMITNFFIFIILVILQGLAWLCSFF